MKKYLLILTLCSLFICINTITAEELQFPTTEKEIVDALTLKDDKVIFQGVEYESSDGKVYKIIGGKRYRMRGLQGIVETKIVPKAGALVLFDFDAANIRPNSYPLLDEFGKAFTGGLAGARFLVVGHTDNVGAEDYNQRLSQDRARNVADYLITKHSVDSSRLIVKGYGEAKPVTTNQTEQGRAKNRRVEFIRID